MTTHATAASTSSRHESPELGAMIRRTMRGLVRRAAEGDTEALEVLAELEAELATAKAVAVELAASGHRMGGNRPEGYSFTELGAVLGTSRQAARQLVNGPGAARLVTERASWYRQPKGTKATTDQVNPWCRNAEHQAGSAWCLGREAGCWA